MTSLLSERLALLMEKPGGYLALVMTAGLLMLALVLYLVGLRGMWRQQEELAMNIVTVQRTVSYSQVALLGVPSRQSLDRALQEDAARRQTSLPLAQQFAQPLKDAPARLVRWQPVTEKKTEPQGALQLQLSFNGLTHFLSALLQRPAPAVFSELSLQTTGAGMNASVLLTQAADAGEITQKVFLPASERDPFAVPDSSACSDVSPMPEWGLSGTSYAEGKRVGWLVFPDGRWIKAESGSPVGLSRWTVEALNAAQIELMLSDVRCGVKRQILRLGKGRHAPGKGK